MINSLMSRMGEAQKLSIPQLQQAIQDGTLPPYVGIPLLQDKMKQKQAAQASQQQPQQPPIAQQVMQEASMHDRGVEALPSNLPTEEMYDGGIVAFAGGDVVDDDMEDYNQQIEDTEDQTAIAQNLEAQEEGIDTIPRTENKGTGLTSKEPIPAGASKGINADMARKHNVGNLRPVGFKYEGQIGVSPGGFAMFENREYGIKALNHDIGVKLERGLNTPEKFLNVYAPKGDKNDTEAYIQNVSSALGIKPNQEIPNTPEAKMVLAQAITRQEGADKATARFVEGGIIGLAKGGHINYYADPTKNPNENQVTSSDDDQPISAFTQFFQPSTPEEKQFAADYIAKQKKTADIQKQLTDPSLDLPFYKAVKPSERADIESNRSDLLKQLQSSNPALALSKPPKKEAPTENAAPSVPVTTASSTGDNIPSAPVDTTYSDLMQQFKTDSEDRKKQKTIDGYMGLLSAGLGMMGGTSPYAMANIGQGALAGVKQYADSRKQAATEQAYDMKNQIALMRAQEISKSNTATSQRLALQAGNTNFLSAVRNKETILKADPTFNMKTPAEQNAILYSDPSIQYIAKQNNIDLSSYMGGGSNTNGFTLLNNKK